MKRKLYAAILSLVLILGTVLSPITVGAEETSSAPVTVESTQEETQGEEATAEEADTEAVTGVQENLETMETSADTAGETDSGTSGTENNISLFTPANGTAADLTIFHTNDMHSRVENLKYVTTMVNEARLAGNTLFVDAGDATQGNAMATYTSGRAIIDIMNAAGYDLMTLGNHEFDYGTDVAYENIKAADFPVISANVVDAASGNIFLDGATDGNGENWITEIEANGTIYKVGFFGITTVETTYKTNPLKIADVNFLDEVATAQLQVDYLKSQGVDFIIGLIHVGIDASSDPTSHQIAAQVDGIDLLIDGHSHSEDDTTVNGTRIVQTGYYLSNVGKVEINVDNGKLVVSNAELIPIADVIAAYGVDTAVETAYNDASDALAPILNEVVGVSETPIYAFSDDGAQTSRLEETPAARLVADSMKWAGEQMLSEGEYSNLPVVSLQNGGGVRSTLPAGEITVDDVLTVLPFGNMISVKVITPDKLYSALENGVSALGYTANGYIDLSSTNGRFLQISGMSVEVDLDGQAFDQNDPQGSPGSRVSAIYLDGSNVPLDRNDTTTQIAFVSNDFEIAGGDGYVMLTDLPHILEGGLLDAVLVDYIEYLMEESGTGSFNYASTAGRINVAQLAWQGDYVAYTFAAGLTPNTTYNVTVDGSFASGTSTEMTTDAGGSLFFMRISSGMHTISVSDGTTEKFYYVSSFTNKNTELVDSSHFTIFHTNDMHGNVENLKYVKTMLDETANSVLVDAGDAVQGTALATYTDGSAIVDIMNAAGYSGMVLGNHEFDFSTTTLLELALRADFPVISANTLDADGNLLLEGINGNNGENFIVELAGYKVGFFGITTTETSYKSNPTILEGVTFGPEIEYAKAQVAALQSQGVDLIVGLVHVGVDSSADPTSYQIAEAVDGIDILIDGHSHTEYTEIVNNTLITQTGSSLSNVGRIDISVVNTPSEGVVWTIDGYLIPIEDIVANYNADTTVEALYNTLYGEVSEALSDVIGYSNTPIYAYGSDGSRVVRVEETPLGSLIADAMKASAEKLMLEVDAAKYANMPVVSLETGGSIRADLPMGEITLEDVITVLPYGNVLAIKEVTPNELYQIMENGFSKLTFDEENGIIDVSSADGRYPQFAGMSIEVDLTKPAYDQTGESGELGSRVTAIYLQNDDGTQTLLDRDDTTTKIAFAATDYECDGGDAYSMLVDLPNIARGDLMDVLVSDYITALTEAGGGSFTASATSGRALVKQITDLQTKKVNIVLDIVLTANTAYKVTVDGGTEMILTSNNEGYLALSNVNRGAHTVSIDGEYYYVSTYTGKQVLEVTNIKDTPEEPSTEEPTTKEPATEDPTKSTTTQPTTSGSGNGSGSNSTSNGSKTGDDTSTIPWIFLGIVCLAVIGGAGFVHNKNRKNKEGKA